MKKPGLFIGLTTLDIQYFVDKHPEANSKVKTLSPVIAAGGPSANAAIAYSFLGGEAHFLTCLGDNHFSGFLNSDFQTCKVKVLDALRGLNYNPIVATVITNTSNSDRTIVTHHPERGVVSSIFTNEINIDLYSFVFTDGFYPELAVPLIQAAKKKGIPVIFDGGSWKPQMPELLPYVNIAICSGNYCPPGCNSIDEIITYTKMLGVDDVAISRGADAIVSDLFSIEIETVKAVDSLAAGDILHGAFCWYYAKGNSFKMALEKASKIATQSTLYLGTRAWMTHDNNKE